MPPGRSAIGRSLLALLSVTMLASCADEREPRGAARGPTPRGPRTVTPARARTLDASGVLDATRSSVVIVESLDRRRNVVAQGSGVIVGKHTVITAWPLVSRAFAIRVRTPEDVRPTTLTAVMDRQGLARLSVEVSDPVELGRDAPPSPGQSVYAVGAAQGDLLSVMQGIVSDVRAEAASGLERVETTLEAPAGFAGGGLFDAHGELIGIMVPSHAGGEQSRAIPVRFAKDLLALPEGSLPKVTQSPLRRLSEADRRWLLDFMGGVARGTSQLNGLGLDRVNALLDRLDPLVGAELDRVKEELGLGLLAYQRLFWEDAVEARTFRRAVRSARRAASERDLLALGILTRRELSEGNANLRAIAAHEAFDVPGARIDANERYVAQMISQVDRTRRVVETQLWEARQR